MIPGWPYSFVAALEPGRTSWTLPLDAVRLGPADDATEVTAAQVRGVIARIIAAGQWADGDPDVMVVFDSGYDLTRLAWLLCDLPVEVAGRLRSDRVMYFPAPQRQAGVNGRPPRHGAALRFADPRTWPEPVQRTVTVTSRYGTVQAMAWARLHQKLTSRAGWEDHDGPLPVIEGTLIRLHATSHLPGYRALEPMWLWSSRPDASSATSPGRGRSEASPATRAAGVCRVNRARRSSGPVRIRARAWPFVRVRSPAALRLATISARIASTAPSRPLGAPRARPDCAARAALTASSGSDLPARRRSWRSERSTSTTRMPAAVTWRANPAP
jgi:hypothetical protein